MTALTNGNYVVSSWYWHNGESDWLSGAVTWGSGTAGVSGVVSSDNSLVGSTEGDEVGCGGVTALTNGNYVVESPFWSVKAGAATWGSGTTGISGVVSNTNSLIGSTSYDMVGCIGSDPYVVGVFALTNGNYVVCSPNWNNGIGAGDLGERDNGHKRRDIQCQQSRRLHSNDKVGSSMTALTNGNYVVCSPNWAKSAITNTGAVTWGSGTAGVRGGISTVNSLVGTKIDDQVGT